MDEKYNICLDAERDYQSYLKDGEITQEQYEQSCREFRGGVLKLTADNFLQYLTSSSVKILSSDDLRGCLGGGQKIFEDIERYFLTGEGLTQKLFEQANVVKSRLPGFYINFDRKIFMHMDDYRDHESSAYPDWFAQCADFNFLIPTSERYWMVDGDDYWKFLFI
ncbi:hypothetical protein [Pseudomonas sp. KNUC1026]|uniref:hypothetical protein n=1 Tax=Pseudomonas sp. KNUC1026 TaxID=2893890 RepID=UPI002E365B8F|nr:hypothetical protein [Pseudomonas sp. KNUC1026]